MTDKRTELEGLKDLGVTRRNVLKTTGATVATGGLIGAASAPAAARNPHCLRNKTSASGPDANGDLEVCFKIAGLGNEDVIVTTTADTTACYACRNRGGNFPQDPKKQQEEAEVRNEVRITPENGKVEECLTLEEPPTNLDCPGGQEAVLVSVSYTNVRIVTTDAESGDVLATCSIRGTFSRQFIDAAEAQCE